MREATPLSTSEVGGLRIEPLTGAVLQAALDDVAHLRVSVFRDWPYLYDGTLDHERGYIAAFAGAVDGIVVAARDAGRIVGIATGAPLISHTPEFAPLFAARGLDPARVFYCGESVLLASYRGRGVGHAFFDFREAHARRLVSAAGPFTHAAFCGVVRGSDDPRAPAGYAPLDAFWRKRGYEKVDGLVGAYSWQEVGGSGEVEHPMQFWMKSL